VVLKGYFQLAKARYGLGSTLSSLSFDMGTKATTFVDMACGEGGDNCRYVLRHGVFRAEAAASQEKRRSPLQWYGGLPPQALRQSAEHFAAAVECAVELASIKHRMLHALQRYRQLTEQKAAQPATVAAAAPAPSSSPAAH